jgi:hypothetical protein
MEEYQVSKAEELINKFSSVENALICVETILEDLEESECGMKSTSLKADFCNKCGKTVNY